MRFSYQSPLNAHANLSRGAGGITLGFSLHLHLNFMFASREGTGQSAEAQLSICFLTVISNKVHTGKCV